MGVKITEVTPDSSVTGVELIPVSDAGTAKSVTITNIKDFVVDSIEAIAAGSSVTGSDSVFILQSGALKPMDIDVIAQHGIDTMWGKAAETSPDSADILLLKDGGTTEKTVTLAYLAAYMLATNQAAILDVSDLSAHSSIIAADKFLVTSGTTGKYCTFTTLSDAVLASLQAYVLALSAVTVPADADIFYVSQGGTQKKVTLALIKAECGDVFAPASTTENNIPQWDSAADTLKDGLSLQTTVRADGVALDTAVPSEAAVRDLEKTIVYDQTDIGAALADADEFIVDDGGAGTTQRKTALSRFWTYVTSKIQGLSAKTSPVTADILTIQDSADSNNLKELTLDNLKAHLNTENLTEDYYTLKWMAGAGRLPQLNASIANEVADHDFEILGTNASDDDVTFYAEGGLQMQTDGADGDEVILLPHLDTNQTAWTNVTWGTDQQTRWECRIRTGASIANCIIWAGLKLTNTEVTATDDDQAFFRYEDDVNNGEWQAVSSIAGADDAHDTNVVVAADTEYHLVIEIQSDRTAKFYINNTLVETSAALTTAKDLIPYIGVAADGAAAAKTLYVRGQAIRRIYA